ncbi:anthocyanidin 3-O-glucosyltransferase 7-like [Camellia sinensis]|uniref:anthocyanidin 3-O-glucosyltransferase 7-like n=1 Tax=Camellia sinensis TaxID=4442 RepID=UPI001036EB9A|nr:anthocyanidin 3-O-glucosyltransferase 7-like [Camellia sinensis]
MGVGVKKFTVPVTATVTLRPLHPATATALPPPLRRPQPLFRTLDIPDDDFDENKPLWKYITKLAKPREGGGNCQLQCILENIDKTLKFIPGLSAVSVDDLPDGIILGNLESPIAQMLHNMGLKLPKAAAVVLNSFEELEPATAKDLKSKLQKVLQVGPSILSSPAPSDSDETGCLLWLDNQKPASVAYISFGTITTPPPNEVLALAETLVSSEVPFLWSLRDHSRHLFPKGFVENTVAFGKVVSWAPQLQVLAHPSVGVFVTHCGWNSILESITGGVPMICRPFFGDQTLNSRMVQDTWRIGVRVEGGVFTKSGTTSSLELVLSQEEGKKMRENIKVLKQNAIEAVGANGSSSENFKDLLEVIKACKHP